MKVHVSFTLDIDPEAWAAAYSVELSSDIRADVKAYVENGAREWMREGGYLVDDA